MKRTKTLPIIGMAFGSMIVLSSLAFMLVNQNITNNSADDITSQQDISLYEPSNVNTINEIQEQEENVNEQEDEPEDEKEIVLKESGWIPNWGFDLGYESLQYNENIIDTVMPVLYTVNSSGEITSRGVTDGNITKLLSYCRENDIRVIPTVGSYDFESMASAFATSESYKRQIDTIVSEVERYGFDGIDLDYEMIQTSEKDNYLLFLEELGNELRKRNKILSVTVFAQWNDAVYNDHQETRSVQDYTQIGRYADEVRIMAYDFTLQSSKEPGAIAPIDWIREVLDYATSNISNEKVWLGIHLYGYQWSQDRTVAFTYTTAVSGIVNNNGINDVFRDDIGEGYAQFSCDNGQSCTAYFQTPKGVQMRRDIAKEYNIAGVSYWRLGGELDILK